MSLTIHVCLSYRQHEQSSVCQAHDMSVHHTNIKSSPSVCPSYQLSDHHTTTMECPSICQSNHSSDHHICQSRIPSVCHNIILTSPSVCQLQDSSVSYPTRDVIRTTVWPTVCWSSVTSVLPSANPIVKLPMSIPVQKFPTYTKPGKNPFCLYTNGFICPSFRQSIHQLITTCCKPVENPL